MKLAVIPARGGSKRIPRKNIKPFGGKPIISWTIEAARESGCFDQITVSTDDHEIAEVALRLGAEVPFLRPDNLADDDTATIPVIRHAIEWFIERGYNYDYVCCLYATAPFISAEDIARALAIIEGNNLDYVFPVTGYPFPIQRAIRITEQGTVEMFYPENYRVRSQDLEQAWHDAGQFYWGRVGAWLTEKPIFSSRSAPIVLPRIRVQDIDTPEDWYLAEMMYEVLRSKGEKKQ